MKVDLIRADSIGTLYDAAGVCRNSSNPSKALEHSISSGHESILEHCSVSYKISGISRACSHQLVRHRIASYAQQSQRHTVIDEVIDWFVKPPKLPDYEFITAMNNALSSYFDLIDKGYEPEDARYVLPNATKTELVMTINLRSLINFFNHRCCLRAQWEIRELGVKMHDLVRHIYPVVWKYYTFPNCKDCKEKCNGVIH